MLEELRDGTRGPLILIKIKTYERTAMRACSHRNHSRSSRDPTVRAASSGTSREARMANGWLRQVARGGAGDRGSGCLRTA